MDPERWKRLRALLEPALLRPPAERASYLDAVCAAEASLRGELETLLAAHDEAGSFIERAVVDLGATPASSLAAGTTLGRFTVLDAVGSGGMGTVYAAYDSQLDRRVALKLLHAASEERLRREAQALARLSHPNVLTVYDVGSDAGRVFIAMEFVAGETLKAWLAREPRPWPEVVAVFARAGRGLEAAHAAGLVHRDFKPANVLVGGDKVVVADFGLARPADEVPAGGVAGTPAYMAPEQSEHGADSAAADQFSFCVALYEALYGERPYDPAGVRREPPAGTHVPAWLHRVLARGLARDPSARFPSMAALLAALSRDPSVARRRQALLAAAAAAVLAAVALTRAASPRGGPPCPSPEGKLAGVWDEARRAELDRAFTASSAPFADDARRRVRAALDAYARDWVRQRADACEATHVRGEQSADLLDRRMACLDQSLHELGALAARLVRAERTQVEGAARSVSGLTPLARCADTAALMAPVRPPADEDARRKVQELRRRLAEVKAAEDVGDYDRGLELAGEAARAAEHVAYWPLTAEALLRLGALQEAKVQPEEAAASLSRALLAAQAGHHDRVAVEAFTRMVRVEGSFRSNRDGGHRYAAYADALLAPLGRHEDLQASLAINVGKLWFDAADYGRALQHYGRALELRRAAFGPEDPQVAETLSLLGHVHLARGDRTLALARFEESLAVAEKALGPAHPKTAAALDETGRVLFELGQPAAARERHETALHRLQSALGAEHRLVATVLVNLGNAHAALGDPQAALAHHRRAESIVARTLGPEHPRMALVLTSVGNALVDAGDRREALAAYRRALVLQEKAYGASHPAAAATLFNLGETHLKLGEHGAALDHYRRAMTIWEKALPKDHYLRAYGLTGLGEALVGLRRPREARPALESALDIATRTTVEPRVLGAAELALARALEASRGSPLVAVAIARRAVETLHRAGPAAGRDHAAAVAWLEERGVRISTSPRPEAGTR